MTVGSLGLASTSQVAALLPMCAVRILKDPQGIPRLFQQKNFVSQAMIQWSPEGCVFRNRLGNVALAFHLVSFQSLSLACSV